MSRPYSAESVFRALAHKTRRRILESLRKGERFAGEILDGHDVSAPTLSDHLGILRQCGLVTSRRRGPRLEYQINASALREVSTWLAAFEKRLSA